MTIAGAARRGRASAWAVHALTASGAVVGLLSLLAVARGELRAAMLWMLVALVIDSVDGTLARRFEVALRLPAIDGRRLDDVVDYLNYVLVPCFFLVQGGFLPHWGFAALPLLASAYGFSQTEAKTEDHFFVGFPSYWNAVALYVWKLAVSPAAAAAWLVGLSIAVFIPLRYVYPSRMSRFGAATNLGGLVWLAIVAAAVAWPSRLADWPLIWISLLYPVWYVGISVVQGGLHRRTKT